MLVHQVTMKFPSPTSEQDYFMRYRLLVSKSFHTEHVATTIIEGVFDLLVWTIGHEMDNGCSSPASSRSTQDRAASPWARLTGVHEIEL
jgi:hypothetical protein